MKRLLERYKREGFYYFPKFERDYRAYYVLILLAFIRPLGFILQSPVVDGIGAATCISPLPTVFSSPGGIEAFTSNFLIVYASSPTKNDTVTLTSHMFSKITGPHPFRNAISLLFGYFPILPDSSVRSALRHIFYEEHVLQDMGIPQSDQYTLINRNGSGQEQREWSIHISSHEK